MTEEGREEITLEQLTELKRKKGPSFNLDVQVKGTAIIKDKDGNIKSTMEIVSLEEE